MKRIAIICLFLVGCGKKPDATTTPQPVTPEITKPQPTTPTDDKPAAMTAVELGKEYEKLAKAGNGSDLGIKYFNTKVIISGTVDKTSNQGEIGFLYLSCPNVDLKNGEGKPLQIYFNTHDADTIKHLDTLKKGDQVEVEAVGSGTISLYGPGFKDFKFVKKK